MPDPLPLLPSLTPIPGKVYLRRIDAPSVPSPWVIPDASKEKSTECVVVAVPSQPNYEYGVLVPCPLVAGQKVIVGKYSGEYDFRGQKIVVVRIDEVLAIINEQAADNKPSVADLDAVADEKRSEELTARFMNKLAREGGFPEGFDNEKKTSDQPDRAVPRL